MLIFEFRVAMSFVTAIEARAALVVIAEIECGTEK